jgi:hypothetical protein
MWTGAGSLLSGSVSAVIGAELDEWWANILLRSRELSEICEKECSESVIAAGDENSGDCKFSAQTQFNSFFTLARYHAEDQIDIPI